jgi:hypothetical protein
MNTSEEDKCGVVPMCLDSLGNAQRDVARSWQYVYGSDVEFVRLTDLGFSGAVPQRAEANVRQVYR